MLKVLTCVLHDARELPFSFSCSIGMWISRKIIIAVAMAQCVVSFQPKIGSVVFSRSLLGWTRNQVCAATLSPIRLLSTTSDDSEGGKKRVVFLGTPDVAASTLKRLHEDSMKESSSYEIVSVITQPPRRRRRKGKLEPSPVGKMAEELGLPVLNPEKVSREKNKYW